jgi:cytosine/adenosine deaminase-related metal-dependent hydrolase
MNRLSVLNVVGEKRIAAQDSSLALVGARVALDAENAAAATIEIRGGRVASILPAGSESDGASSTRSSPHHTVDLTGYLLLPGLINAHEHLEFNLFPRLGRGPYHNFEDWANDIYHPDRPPLREQLKVPKPIRFWWGIIKNLFAGVTTVCHHNAPIPGALARSFPVNLVERYGWAHSLAFGGDVRKAFISCGPGNPFIIHLAEGTDRRATGEIFRLDRLQALRSRTVIVHGVGLDQAGHALLEQRKAGLIWCPTSNIFTLGKSLDREQIASHRNAALGSDSALTGQGDFLDEIQFARTQARLGPEQIYPLVTSSSARILRLTRGQGTIRVGGAADFIAVPDTGAPPCLRVTEISGEDVELVVVNGEAKLVSASVAARWPSIGKGQCEVLRVGNIERLIRCPAGKILEETKQRLGEEIYLAGKRVAS